MYYVINYIQQSNAFVMIQIWYPMCLVFVWNQVNYTNSEADLMSTQINSG